MFFYKFLWHLPQQYKRNHLGRSHGKQLYGILAKLEREKPRSSRIEKRLYKFFRDANFGILLDKDSKTREKIIHSGKVHILARFEGEIIAQAVLIEKTASVAATIAAEVVMCKG